MQTNTVADSNINVVNRCKQNHQFQIQTQNVPFLQLSTNQTNVKGGQTQVIPVKFDTRNLAPGVYQGQVLVICLSCKSEGTCTQDREVLAVTLRVTGTPAPIASTPSPSPNIPVTTPTSPGSCSLLTQIVHVERDPADMGEGVWLIKIKTADGKTSDIYVRSATKPNLKFCNWIRINECQTIDGDVHVGGYQPAEDPTKPCALTDQIVHVEGDPAGLPDGRWQIRIKTRDGKTSLIYIRSATKPNLKFCNWIKIGSCQSVERGGTNVDGYDPADDPNKPPPPPTPTPVPPPVVSVPPRVDPPPTPTPTSCTDGEIRNKKEETMEFVFADDSSVVEFTSTSTSERGISAALGMAALWRAGAQIGGLATEGLAGPKGSTHGIGFVLNYLDKGADILEKLADSPISGSYAGVSAKVAVTTKKVTVTCTTFEICEGGVWVRKAVLNQVEGRGPVYVVSKKAHRGDDERAKVEKTSNPRYLDPDKVDKWLKDFLAAELKKIKDKKKDYDAFVEKCK